jgi:hypothetical protein
MSCKRIALIAFGVVVGALFVAWAAAPIVAEFIGAYRAKVQP